MGFKSLWSLISKVIYNWVKSNFWLFFWHFWPEFWRVFWLLWTRSKRVDCRVTIWSHRGWLLSNRIHTWNKYTVSESKEYITVAMGFFFEIVGATWKRILLHCELDQKDCRVTIWSHGGWSLSIGLRQGLMWIQIKWDKKNRKCQEANSTLKKRISNTI